MAFDPVPWAITGSQMDTFVMRELANFATRDAEGIQLPGDGKVTASGTNVSIASGGVCVRNVQAAGQSYIGRIASSTLVPIPASGGSAASHLIVATVRDNDFSPWTPWPGGTPTNTILFGPYFYPERLAASNSTVRASQLVTYSSYALARVDMPASTSTVLSTYITDLRSLALPRIGFASSIIKGPVTQNNILITDTSYITWPNNATMGVTVPPWATHCVAEIALNQVQADAAGDFESRLNIGGLVSTPINFDFNGAPQTTLGFVSGVPFSVFADVDVRTLQGQTVTATCQSRRIFTANTGNIWFNDRQQIKFDLRFVERTV